MELKDEYLEYYETCLKALKAQGNYNESYLPMLERYVFTTMKAAELAGQIADEETVVEHENNRGKTNTVTSPKWRMFIALDMQANLLAKNLRLSPATAPKSTKTKKEKAFDTDSKMKVA